MNRVIILAFVLLVSGTAMAQDMEQKLNTETNLIEVVYFHDNGEVSQQGTFNLDRKLHGEWISFDENGSKIAQGTYKNGLKKGSWKFWIDGTQKEVVYENNAVAEVSDAKKKSGLVNKH
ncbi:MAG: nicotinic acid mononucleotide adenyltransferase [Eudoraea sp.]|nr:nicotinic acid mononucleotide adenyltransferase [Eudoraea sp.]